MSRQFTKNIGFLIPLLINYSVKRICSNSDKPALIRIENGFSIDK